MMKKTEPTAVESKEPMTLEEARAFVRTITEEDPLAVRNPKQGYEYGWFAVDGNHPVSYTHLTLPTTERV